MTVTPSFVRAYLDESGSLPDPANPFIVAVCFNPKGARIERIVRKVRRSIPKKKSRHERRLSEFKFSTTTPRTRKRILTLLSKGGIEIAVIAIRKGGHSIEDSPAQYGAIVNALLSRCYPRYPYLALCMDIHFTAQEGRKRLEDILHKGAYDAGASLKLEMADSQRKHALQIADFLAGAFYYKYTRGSDDYTCLVAGNVVYEIVLPWPLQRDS